MGKRNVNQEITLKSREPGKEIQKNIGEDHLK